MRVPDPRSRRGVAARPAPGAAQGIDAEDALQECRPSESSGPRFGSILAGSIGLGYGGPSRFGGLVGRCYVGPTRVEFRHWHDSAAQARARREDPVISHLVRARRRNQRHQAVDQLAALHRDVRGAVAPARLQANHEPAIGALLEPFVRQRWSCDIAAQALQPTPVARGDAHGGVEGHAAALGHARRGVRIVPYIRVIRVHAIADATPRLALLRAVGNSRAQRCSCERGEERLVARERIVVFFRSRRE